MKTFLSWIGGVVLVLSLAGALGAGNFVLKFSTNPIVCTEVSK